ncbi:DMT family transporter [Desulfovibrio sp. JC010]|uniref:DMT family transporter n=1 Tax=Desulfovibrio sp. JC010 TaxID=2593641 RepID=UPI0013D5E456|nr:DMT family transporter [Desulfovibrio sp. JC010]NDV26656.1 DMT family transporter [Desulfovibrio sp. JC010]
MLKPKSSTSLGVAQVLSGAALISLVGIFIKIMVVDYAQPIFVVTFWRNLFVSTILMAGLKIFKPHKLRFEREHIGLLAAYGLVLVGLNGIWGGSVYFNGAGVATVLVYVSVPITVLAQWALGDEKPTLRILPSILFCLFGCGLVCGIKSMSEFSLTPMGMFLGLLSSVFFSAYTIMGRECAKRNISSYSVLMHVFGIAAFYMLIINLFAGNSIPGAAPTPAAMLMPGVDWKGWGCILTLAIGPSMTGWTLINSSLTHLSPSVVNILLTTEPMMTGLAAIPMLGEYMTLEQWAGCFLIVIGVIVLKKR